MQNTGIMRKALALISTDWHLKLDNYETIVELVRQQCQLAKQNGLNEIICLGDVFDSRISQRMDTLIGFFQILEVCKSENVKLICVPGNHDKTDYTIEKSFLKTYSYHPNLYLIEDYALLERGDYRFHFIPYFAEDTVFKTYLDRVKYGVDDNNVLFSHIAVQGSRNNDGELVNNSLTPKSFASFVAVFLGHYHNYQVIGSNLFHLPSIQQNNFGEDTQKGFTLLYDDLDFEIIRSNSKVYQTVTVDLDLTDYRGMADLIAKYDPVNTHCRLLLSGSKEQMQSVDVKVLQERGFVVQSNEKNISYSIDAVQNTEVVKYNIDHIIKLFKSFCEERKLNYEEGMTHLNYIITKAS